MDTQKLNRRSFLKGSALSLGAMTMGNMLFAHAHNKREESIRDFSLSFTYKSRFETHNTLNLWLPLALSNGFQTPYNLRVEGNYDDYSLGNDNNTPILHAVWRHNDNEKHLKTTLNLKAKFLESSLDLKDFTDYQPQDRYIRSNPTIAGIVNSLVADYQSDRQKAEKLFAWVTRNISSQDGQDIQGIRSIKDINGNEILRGENLSASSVFVALCREAGIPSFECFGISLDSGRYALNDSTPKVYTRSVVFVNNAWLVNDSLLAIKAREALQNKNAMLEHSTQRYATIMQDSFTQWDNNWVMLNYLRDITLDSILVSTLQQAYGEVDGAKLSSYNLEHFHSTIAV
ncbi:hypothetical protein CQA66_02450 [Helicobacter aurati]|uniref:Uncharacterized protein n=1 Tax=Helicobacter aurati TaxID=137778 RepID=A0A3D8J6N6_9HELI|nr:transglutaminase domain-containing protein [Helicobacter aurati]RDU73108.1 hypothetical protein CQA66_02450 [Helicobacter aurati]